MYLEIPTPPCYVYQCITAPLLYVSLSDIYNSVRQRHQTNVYLEISAPLLYVLLRDVHVIERHIYDCETYTSSECIYLEISAPLLYESLRDVHVIEGHTYHSETNTSSGNTSGDFASLLYVSSQNIHIKWIYIWRYQPHVICIIERHAHQVDTFLEVSVPLLYIWLRDIHIIVSLHVKSTYMSGDISALLYWSLRDTLIKWVYIYIWRCSPPYDMGWLRLVGFLKL